MNAVSKVTARMCRQGWLRRYPLIPPEQYFTLGGRAIRYFGYSSRRTEPLGPQALPIDYAVLLFANYSQRTRLLPSEMSTLMPWLPSSLNCAPYCKTSQGIIELVRVDLGGSPRNIARKAARDFSRRLEIPEFCQLIGDGRFQLVILTTTSAKARLIRQSIESLTWQCDIRVHIAIVHRLTYLHLR